MVDQRLVEIRLDRDRQFQHHPLVIAQLVQLLGQFAEQNLVAFGALVALDIHFRLDDRHQPVAQDLLAEIELLLDHGGNALGIGLVDYRAHLGPEHALGKRLLALRVKIRDRFHQLHAVFLVLQPLVDLQERHDAAIPERFRHRLAASVAVHRLLEQDRTDHLAVAEAGRGNDAAAHLVDQRKHFVFIGEGILADAIAGQRLWCGAAALVQRGNETLPVFDLVQHFPIGHFFFPDIFDNSRCARALIW